MKQFSRGERVEMTTTEAPFYQKGDEAVIISGKYNPAEKEIVYLGVFENTKEWLFKQSQCKKVEITS